MAGKKPRKPRKPVQTLGGLTPKGLKQAAKVFGRETKATKRAQKKRDFE